MELWNRAHPRFHQHLPNVIVNGIYGKDCIYTDTRTHTHTRVDEILIECFFPIHIPPPNRVCSSCIYLFNPFARDSQIPYTKYMQKNIYTHLSTYRTSSPNATQQPQRPISSEARQFHLNISSAAAPRVMYTYIDFIYH